MTDNPLIALKGIGQSVWLDYIERGLLDQGGLKRLIDEDGLAGVTSNPSIFHKAITTTGQYDDAIARLADTGADATDIYLQLVTDDIRNAADILRPVYDDTGGADGYVSLEVSPHLAHDTDGSIAQARTLWARIDRPNLMVKIPGTRAGLPAIEQLIADGINVNVTLLFSVDRYREVADAYMNGLEARARRALPLNGIASVASFFLSRIDSAVDKLIAGLGDRDQLAGKTAIACARTAYSTFCELSAHERWQKLDELGARPQRLLWASTSTKNPAYSDVLYVDSLIGPLTVNTVPPKTLDAYRKRGKPARTVDQDLEDVAVQLRELKRAGIDVQAVADRLESEGVAKFVEAFDDLLDALDGERLRLRSA